LYSPFITLNYASKAGGKGPVPFPQHSTKPIDITCWTTKRISISKAYISRYLSRHASVRPLPVVSYLSQAFPLALLLYLTETVTCCVMP